MATKAGVLMDSVVSGLTECFKCNWGLGYSDERGGPIGECWARLRKSGFLGKQPEWPLVGRKLLSEL